jgi:hypothetical protein
VFRVVIGRPACPSVATCTNRGIKSRVHRFCPFAFDRHKPLNNTGWMTSNPRVIRKSRQDSSGLENGSDVYIQVGNSWATL